MNWILFIVPTLWTFCTPPYAEFETKALCEAALKKTVATKDSPNINPSRHYYVCVAKKAGAK